jgi:tRNA(adenine34) deaminase
MTTEAGTVSDETYMRECLELGRGAAESGEAPVGSIIVRAGKILARGSERTKASHDVTAHAEIEAIRNASQLERTNALNGCTLYTNVEPCVLCSYAIRRVGIERVVIGAPAGSLGGVRSNHPILVESGIPGFGAPPAITLGVLLQECNDLLSRRSG